MSNDKFTVHTPVNAVVHGESQLVSFILKFKGRNGNPIEKKVTISYGEPKPAQLTPELQALVVKGTTPMETESKINWPPSFPNNLWIAAYNQLLDNEWM